MIPVSLVPPMRVLLTRAIAYFSALALFGRKFGLREFMAVGVLPFVILIMTIERFFWVIKEAGVREGLRTAVGSASTSVIAYKIISWEFWQLTFWVYIANRVANRDGLWRRLQRIKEAPGGILAGPETRGTFAQKVFGTSKAS